MLKVGTLKELLKEIDDDVTIHTVNSVKMLPSVKHVHLAKYIDDDNGEEILVFCSMGNHLPDTIELIKGAS